VWPLIPFSYRTITDAPGPFPARPSRIDWLGTDDQGRDVLARLIYGFRISVLFGLALTVFSSIVGVAAGAVQGYFRGAVGFGLPPGSASLGELLAQGKANLQAPWLGITAFFVLAIMLSLLIFIGEAVRDAFDPRKVTP